MTALVPPGRPPAPAVRSAGVSGGAFDLQAILAALEITRRADPYTYVHGHWPALAELAAATIAEERGPTLVATVAQCAAAGAPVGFVAAWLTVTATTALDGVGLTAALSGALAAGEISCNVLAGYHHDHLLVPWERADEAVALLTGLRTAGGAIGPFRHKPTVVGTRVALRPIVADDAEALWADLADPEARRLTGTHATFTRAEIDRWAATRGDQADRLDLAVTDAVTGAWLGEVVINDWDPDNASCGFRIALAAAARDRGIGTEATRLIVDHVLSTHPDVHRIELEVYAFNPRARTVYERAGFVHEGTRRSALRWGGEWIDALTMAILRPDWTARQQGVS